MIVIVMVSVITLIGAVVKTASVKV